MNKADLIEVLAPRLGGRAAATASVEAIVDVVMREVVAGGSVGISGFGTFESIQRAPRTGRNPRTGEAVAIDATMTPRFRPGTYFKDVVTDPSRLPKDGLAGVRVSVDGGAAAASGAPVSIRRDAQPKTTSASASRAKAAAKAKGHKVSGTPASVRAVPADSATEESRTPPPGRVMTGGEEITMRMISAKKAQLARAKDDQLVAGKTSKKKRKKKGKNTSGGKA
ncbi:MAG: HU family DNA-binding protein [Ornithinimicrobium sp.]|uniref:HU family DNA-binding protein n=1 Tax=Ornithinimicrobium sp. TaxID=1977084 RepID=UPI0026DF48EA|nr:HU family DNA-binding protein [Ornithinimicrobium sp.]MDO5740318.1 HU family DNA-binding protein [Ornithinimicrobium sp.]